MESYKITYKNLDEVPDDKQPKTAWKLKRPHIIAETYFIKMGL